MRWFTLVLSVTLFYSLSFVNAIPHDIDEKRHWLHRRQGLTGSSSPVVPSPSGNPQGESSSSVVQPTRPPNTTQSSSRPLPSPTSDAPSPTPQPTSESSSSVVSSSSSSGLSSESSLSSTSSSVRSITSPTPSIANRPASTSNRRFSSTYELPSDTASSDGSIETGSGSGSSFLKNKAAMGSTFAIVGLIGVAIIAGGIFFVVKKARKRRDDDELDTYFEKLPANNGNNGGHRNVEGGNDYGLGPSAAELATPANDQAYVSRDVHYGAANQYPSQYPDQYPDYNGLEYPPERGSVSERPTSYAPGTAYAAAMAQRGPYHYEGRVEDPNTVPNHPFADPDRRRY